MAIAGWFLAPPLRRLTDAVVTVAGLITAIGVSEGATQFLKLFIQRRRPNFYALCGFDVASRQCTAALTDIRESQFSFPSGHSSLAACSMTFMSWYFVNKIVESNALRATQKRAFSLVTCCLLPGWAVFIGATRLVDHWHHPSDVVAGLVLGSVVASITYHTYYYPLQQQAADADPLRIVY
jgi:diacylglycerol diphosphate phosphatase / phosphatidate phosphatase